MKKVTVEKVYAFIGLYLYRGLYKLNTLSAAKLFPSIFSATMSKNRFVFSRAPSPLMMKQREQTDDNMTALRP